MNSNGISMFIHGAKSFYKSYPMTVWFLIGYSIIVYTTVLQWANPAPPENQLHWFHAKVVFAQQDHPNMRVEMSDGSIRDLDFYANLTGVIRGLARFSGTTNHELAKLQGYQVEIGTDSIRWLILPQNQRIWAVRCENFPLPYSKLIKTYQFHRKLGVWICAGLNCFFVLIITILFIAERRKKSR